MKKQIHTKLCWASLISLFISIVTFCIFWVRIEPFELSNAGVVGVVATLMGICATLMVGLQIFSSLQVKTELKEIRELNDELKKTTEEQDKKLEEEKDKRERQNRIIDAKVNTAQAFAFSDKQILTSYFWFTYSTKVYFELNEISLCLLTIKWAENTISEMENIISSGTDIEKIDYYTSQAKRLDDPQNSHLEAMKSLPNYLIIKDKIEPLESRRKKIVENAMNIAETKDAPPLTPDNN